MIEEKNSIKTKVSVIVPVYNSEQYLSQCIESILAQTFIDFECILVDDCSQDRSLTICSEYAKKDNRIIVIHNDENMGASLSRKKGLLIAKGDYIQYIDSDDWIEKNMIDNMYRKALLDDLDMVICDCYYNKDDNEIIRKQNFSGFQKIDIIKSILSINVNTYLVNKIVKRDVFLKAVFPVYYNSEDYVITIQNIYNSNNIGYINFPLYHYRYNPSSLTNNSNTKIRARIHQNKNWHMLINFLNEKYGERGRQLFEPELSNHVNDFKDEYIFDKDLWAVKGLFKLYPESHYFRKRFIKSILKKILPEYMIKFLRRVKNDNGRTFSW